MTTHPDAALAQFTESLEHQLKNCVFEAPKHLRPYIYAGCHAVVPRFPLPTSKRFFEELTPANSVGNTPNEADAKAKYDRILKEIRILLNACKRDLALEEDDWLYDRREKTWDEVCLDMWDRLIRIP